MEGLQNTLNSLEQYCNKWHLTVNVNRTKIVVFRKGGALNRQYRWSYAGNEIEIVQNFNYLGIVFSSGGSFMQATNTLSGKGLKAMNMLFSVTKSLCTPIHIMFNLFDSYVLSILNYNCEVWGFLKAENIERVQKKFCKWLLNVKKTTNTLSLYSECGRFPLYIERHIRIIKYWLKLNTFKSENCILYHIVKNQRYCIEHNQNVSNWTYKVRKLLQESGFEEIWLFPESVNINMFIPELRLRLRDIYIQNWRTDMNSCTSLYIYREIKLLYVKSAYLEILDSKKYRNAIAKLRLGSHNLAIETGRHRQVDRTQRKCNMCNLNDLEDEFHFVLKCPFYSNLRQQFISSYYSRHPSVFKFISLINSDRKSVLIKLAKYCIQAFEIRNEVNIN
jgi:hypothetical protein